VLPAEGGGFLYQPLLARRAGPEGPVERLPQGPPVRLLDVGQKYEWVVQRLDLPDHALALPFRRSITRLMRPFLKESGSVVFGPTLCDSPRVPMAGALAQVTFGYAVVPWRIDPTILGFGPGRFFSAVKLASTGKADEALKQFAAIGHQGYGALAKLSEAGVLTTQGKAAEAAKI